MTIMAGIDSTTNKVENVKVTDNAADVNSATLLSGENQTANVLHTADKGSVTAISASALIKSGSGTLVGILVTSQGAGDTTIKVWDSLSATGTVMMDTTGSIIFATLDAPVWIPFPASFTTGCYVTLAGTTPKVSVIYN